MNIEQRSIEIAHEFIPGCKCGEEIVILRGDEWIPYKHAHSEECKELALKIRELVDVAVREVLEETLRKSQLD